MSVRLPDSGVRLDDITRTRDVGLFGISAIIMNPPWHPKLLGRMSRLPPLPLPQGAREILSLVMTDTILHWRRDVPHAMTQTGSPT